MCKGSFSVDNTTDQPTIEANMTLQSRRLQKARSFHTKRNRSLSANRRSQSTSGTHDTFINESLTHGQKLYLLEKCHIYDMEDTKTRHTNACVQVLTRRFNADSLCKPEFRLNDPRDYFNYAKFLKTPRPTARSLNTGYFTNKKPHHPRIPSNHKKQQIDIRSNNFLDKKDFAIRSTSSLTNKKLSKDNSSNPSQRISATSFSTNNENIISVNLRHEPKQIPKIPLVSSQSHD
ncbi:unnamed protein product [Rotaria sp. Silwood2]|nr:unnamed protein product [Rotaria sp. Silwood2]